MQHFRLADFVVLSLPPYSPDLDPLEELFSCVKYYLKKHDVLLQAVDDPIPVIKAASNIHIFCPKNVKHGLVILDILHVCKTTNIRIIIRPSKVIIVIHICMSCFVITHTHMKNRSLNQHESAKYKILDQVQLSCMF